MIELTALTETGLNLNTAVELRKAAAELGIKGASKGRKADLIREIMILVDAAKAEAAAKVESPKAATRKGSCEDCGRKVVNSIHSTLCPVCYDYAGWENTHSDSGHGDHAGAPSEEMADCPVCRPELDKRFSRREGRSRAGMEIVAKGTEVHKSNTFKVAAEAKGWIVKVMDTHEGTEGEDARYVATATKDGDTIELSWNGRAYDYPNSGATLNGKARKVRNLKEALRLL